MSIFGSKADKTPAHTSIGGEEMTSVLREMGFAPELSTSSKGDPMIRFRVEGLRCVIFFYGCTDGRANSIQFYAGFTDKPTLDKVNEWNKTKRYGKAYLDDKAEVCLEMDVEIEGGVLPAYLEGIVGTWRTVLTSFVRAMAG